MRWVIVLQAFQCVPDLQLVAALAPGAWTTVRVVAATISPAAAVPSRLLRTFIVVSPRTGDRRSRSHPVGLSPHRVTGLRQ
ncbi:hypothetical protein GCM10028799_41580 [Kribbella italica]